MKFILILLVLSISITNLVAQEKVMDDALPYYEVPQYPEKYTAGTVAARMVDGLGFRYRWATESLREEDLNYKPSDGARTTMETIDHILGLSRVIINATIKTPTDLTKEKVVLSYKEKRNETLGNFKRASQILMEAANVEDFKIQFISGSGKSEYPFWNNINGPIADAIWHAGQVASFRRSSGNPISPKVKFLEGKIKE